MMNLIDSFVKSAYPKIQKGILKEDMIFTAIEHYINFPLNDEQKTRFRGYIADIKSGKMTFDEYWALYKEKTTNYEKSI